jgi:hypothetical protein
VAHAIPRGTGAYSQVEFVRSGHRSMEDFDVRILTSGAPLDASEERSLAQAGPPEVAARW